MAHAITLKSNLGKELLFSNLLAKDELGRLFSYQLEMISKNADVDMRSLLGTPMVVTLVTPPEQESYTRYFHGIVCEMEQTGFVYIEKVRYAVYSATLVPKPWLLIRRHDCRIYKGKTVPQIIREVLAEIGYSDVKLSLSGNYPAREYCVQYRESTFDFISRLMEQEGIYYYFKHTASAHTMVLADSLGAHSSVAHFEQIPYAPPTEKGSRNRASITDWTGPRTINSTKVQLDDYDYLKPKASLTATEETSVIGETHTVAGLDVFDYPGCYQERAVGQRYAQVRADALNVPQALHHAKTDACGLVTGALFKLKDFPQSSFNQEYLVVASEIRLVEVDYLAHGGSDDGEGPFSCQFQAIKSRQPFRSMATTPWPRISGVQTAVVYGETAEDIVVDKYGRVQVTFFWNLPGKPKAEHSCPVRVATSWAGKRWGAQQIPRVGQEVVVSFLEGNPDRPLIMGSVYNADQMPPYSLPDEKTRSGVKSRSHPGGGPDDYNEIRFEDKLGSEELLLHAQKDLREEAEQDHLLETGRNYRLEAGNQIELVTGAAKIVMKSSGQIEIHGVAITINGSATLSAAAGGELSLKSAGPFRASSGSLMNLGATATVTVEGAAVTLLGTVTANGMPVI